MTFDEMYAAVTEAKQTIAIADSHVSRMADMCRDRLRTGKVSTYTLERLKRELRNFNIHTGTWK